MAFDLYVWSHRATRADRVEALPRKLREGGGEPDQRPFERDQRRLFYRELMKDARIVASSTPCRTSKAPIWAAASPNRTARIVGSAWHRKPARPLESITLGAKYDLVLSTRGRGVFTAARRDGRPRQRDVLVCGRDPGPPSWVESVRDHVGAWFSGSP